MKFAKVRKLVVLLKADQKYQDLFRKKLMKTVFNRAKIYQNNLKVAFRQARYIVIKSN